MQFDINNPEKVKLLFLIDDRPGPFSAEHPIIYNCFISTTFPNQKSSTPALRPEQLVIVQFSIVTLLF